MVSLAPATYRDPVALAITVDGESLGALQTSVREVTVQMSRAAATTLAITLDCFRAEGGSWSVQDSGRFLPWREITVVARFGAYEEEVFRGCIKQIQAEYPEALGGARVVVEAQDNLLLLDRVHLREVHRPDVDASAASGPDSMTDGALVRALVQRLVPDGRLATTSASVEDGLKLASLHQDETAATFLRTRAEANGYELFVRGTVLHFHAPRFDWEAPATIVVHGGAASSCQDFRLWHDGHKPDRVRLTCAAEQGVAPVDETFTSTLGPPLGSRAASASREGLPELTWCLRRPRGATLAELRSRAQAAANANAWKIVAEGELDGSLYGHVLFAHQTVQVEGIGTTYSGRFYVDEVTHRFASDGYRQRFRLLRNATH